MSKRGTQIEFSGPLGQNYKEAVLQAANLVLRSVRMSQLPKIIRVTVKRLNVSRGDVNPTGWTNSKDAVVIRVSDNVKKYPCLWYQTRHPEWPRLKMRNPVEAAFLTAAHEFAHLALNCEGIGNKAPLFFEEWLCEVIATNSLLARRGVIISSLC